MLLFGMHNRTCGPLLAAIQRTLVPVMIVWEAATLMT
jgi:hypothetical protein